jgi:TP901 family phage tail tape measure protein
MATKRIEARLAIKAVDQYSGMLKNMRTVTGRFADSVRSKMGGLQNLRGPLKLIEDFRRQRQVVRRSGEAMEAAREKQRRLLAEIRATRNPSAQLRREFDRARQSADRLEQQHRQNRRALHGLQGQLRNAGVNTGDLSGEQRRLAGALDSANASFGRQMERLRRLERMQGRIAEARERMDRSLATAANLSFVGNASMQTGRRIIAGLRSPVQQAIEFESAMSDVKKVVDFDSPAAFKQMSEDILELSTRIPMASEGLAQIVAAGGQSGLKNEELLKFAELAAKVGVAFDISAERSGDAMANIKTALGLSLDETSALFDAMNHLSNNMASTAPKVLDFTTRVAADGKVKGFDPTETLAFGSAMIAAGAQADVAATSFRNMSKALVRGAASTPKQRAAFKSLGLDAAQVARRMQEDAVGTTIDVMERINQLPEHLRSSTVSQIFGDEARALMPLIGNLDLLRESLGLVSEERNYLGSAEAEYAARAETTANNIQLMRNQMARLGVSIGEVVLPHLNDLLERSQGIIDRFVKWTKEHPKLTKWLVLGGAAIGAMAIAGGALLTAAAGLIGTLAVLRFGLVGLGARAAFAAGDLLGVGRAFGGLGRLAPFALSGLLKPVKWGAKLIGRIPWVRLAGRLAIGSLLFPFRWTSRLVPKIGWARLAGRLAINSLLFPFRWTSRLIPKIGWANLAGKLSISGLIYPFRWTSRLVPKIGWARLAGRLAINSLLFPFRWTSRLIPKIGWASLAGKLSISGLIYPFRWTSRLVPKIGWARLAGRLAINSLLFPFRWTSRLIPKIGWAKLVGKLALSSLVTPLRWTAALLPNFAPALARFAGFRRSASAEMATLSSNVQRHSASMQRSMSRVKWGAFSAGAMGFLAMRNVPDNPEDLAAFQESNVRSMGRFFRNTPGISHLIEGYERTFELVHGKPPPVEPALLPNEPGVRSAADTVYQFAGEENLPTAERITHLREEVAAYREEVEAARAALEATPEFGSGITNPLRVQAQGELDAAEAGLRRAEERLKSAEAASAQLTEALQVLNVTGVAPEISTASIHRALAKVQQLAAGIRALPSGGSAEVSSPKPAGARAGGGPVRSGLPYLVNEDTPRSEWFVPSRSGGILNVGQAQSAFRSYLTTIGPRQMRRPASSAAFAAGASRVRAASLAALSATAVALPAAAAPAAAGKVGGGDVRVEINGGINVQVPSGVTDPEFIADLVLDRVGDRVSGTIDASFSD